MNYKYRRHNPKTIAIIVEISLMALFGILIMILDGVGIKLPWIPVVIVFVVLMFSLILTLSLLRYDAMRDIRADGSFKGSNLPLFTDHTTLQGHDIVEEKNKKENIDK